MLKLKLQYFGHLMQRNDSLEKILMLGKIEGRRRRGQQRMIWLDGIINQPHEFEQASGVGNGHRSLVCSSPWGRKELDMTEGLNWCEELTHWERSWCWERLKAGGEGDEIGWDAWMTSLTWWTWVRVGPGVGDDGQGSLACYSPCGSKEPDITERLNWTEAWTAASQLGASRMLRCKNESRFLKLALVILYWKTRYSIENYSKAILWKYRTEHIYHCKNC